MINKYAGTCHDCGQAIAKGDGILERISGKYVVWCKSCYNKSDNSGDEDRCCGNRAYEDQCAVACGFDY